MEFQVPKWVLSQDVFCLKWYLELVKSLSVEVTVALAERLRH